MCIEIARFYHREQRIHNTISLDFLRTEQGFMKEHFMLGVISTAPEVSEPAEKNVWPDDLKYLTHSMI